MTMSPDTYCFLQEFNESSLDLFMHIFLRQTFQDLSFVAFVVEIVKTPKDTKNVNEHV